MICVWEQLGVVVVMVEIGSVDHLEQSDMVNGNPVISSALTGVPFTDNTLNR